MSASQQAIFFSVLGFFLFSVGDITRKYLLQFYNPLDIQCLTAIFSVLVILACGPWLGGFKSLVTLNRPYIHALKAVIVMMIIFMAIFALDSLDLATIYTLIFLAPLLTSIGAAIFFKEHLHTYHYISLVAGFIGVLVILRPGFDGMKAAMIYPLALSLLFAANSLLNKLFPANDPRLPFGFYPYILTVFVCLIMLGGRVVPFELMHIPLLALAGGTSSIAMVMMVVAFQVAPAAVAAPYQYTQLIWGIAFGYLLFHDIPDIWTIAGSVLIIGAGLYLYYAENSKRPMFSWLCLK